MILDENGQTNTVVSYEAGTGRCLSYTEQGGAYQFQYGSSNQPGSTLKIEPNGWTNAYAYNEFGNKTNQTAPLNLQILRTWPPNQTIQLTWPAAAPDTGENGASNIVGYDLDRSTNGITFTKLNTIPIPGHTAADLPPAGQYFYALGLVYRGNPPVSSAVFSSNSLPLNVTATLVPGLPDYWVLATGLTDYPATTAADDADGDGMSYFEEWLAGTSPTNRHSFLFVKSIAPANGRVTIRWDGAPGVTYTLSRTFDLAVPAWEPVYGPVLSSSSSALEYVDAATATRAAGYYRLMASRP